jgi:hypothetical protein
MVDHSEVLEVMTSLSAQPFEPGAARMNPYVFIVGCPRSGTTLLRRMLNAHPEIAITRETHWLPSVYLDGVGLTPEGFVTPELIPILEGSPRFSKLGISTQILRELVSASEPIHYSNFVSALFDLYGGLQNKPLVGDKTPGYVRRIRLMHSLWPNARFVHLIRDGRDNCLSAIDWKDKADGFTRRFSTWADDPISTAAVWWKWHVELGREAAQTLPEKLYHEVRYEGLVADPVKECALLCEFLEVPYTHALITFHEGKTKSDSGLDAKKAWLPITSGLRDWRRQMASDDLERFEAVAGELLEELDYPRAVSLTKPATRTHAAQIFDSFVQNAQAKNRSLPEKWLRP